MLLLWKGYATVFGAWDYYKYSYAEPPKQKRSDEEDEFFLLWWQILSQ